MVVAAVRGMAGVGKTALAVEWAPEDRGQIPRRPALREPQGLRPGRYAGHAEDEVTSWFLSPPLACPPREIPVSASARAGLYRSVLAERRVLIVLDNARNDAQVRPLLAGGPGCLVVVTSRCALTGLVASAGSPGVQLSPLDADEGMGRCSPPGSAGNASRRSRSR